MKNAIFWDVGSQSVIKLAPLEETHHSNFKVYKYESSEFRQNACRYILQSKGFLNQNTLSFNKQRVHK
jgi:hypothetical protein